MTHGNARHVEDTLWDRLVDGELTPEEYRALVASLDDSPDGWRRCAIAFLEAQALGRELQALALEAQSCGRRAGGPARRWRVSDWAWLALASAASFLLAFGIAWNVRPGGDVIRGPERLVAERLVPPAGGPRASSDGQAGGSGQDVREPPSASPLGTVPLLIARHDGRTEELQLPVYEMTDDVARWFLETATPVPPEVQRALRSLGYEVRRDRRWAPVPARGDRRVLVPIEQVEIRPVSGGLFH